MHSFINSRVQMQPKFDYIFLCIFVSTTCVDPSHSYNISTFIQFFTSKMVKFSHPIIRVFYFAWLNIYFVADPLLSFQISNEVVLSKIAIQLHHVLMFTFQIFCVRILVGVRRKEQPNICFYTSVDFLQLGFMNSICTMKTD